MLYILFSTDVFVVNLLIDNVKILLHVMIENEALFVFLLVILYYLDWIIL